MDVPLSIQISNECPHYTIHEEGCSRIMGDFCKNLELSYPEISLSFVSIEKIKSLNLKYRDNPSQTDVLSFPQVDWESPLNANQMKPDLILGDIIICIEVALENAKAIGQTLSREVAFLICHGLLHLCGYDHLDKDDEMVMLEKQKILMGFLNPKDIDELVH